MLILATFVILKKTPLSIEIHMISKMPKGVSVTRLGLEPKTPTLKV